MTSRVSLVDAVRPVTGAPPAAQIAVERPHPVDAGRRVLNRAMVVHDVDAFTDVPAQVEPRTSHLFRSDLDDPHARNATPRRRQQRHLVTGLDQALTQPHRDALRTPVLRDGEPHVVELDDVHGRRAGTRDVGRPAGSVPVSSRWRYIRRYSSAITMWVKNRSACARQAAGSRVWICSAAAMISSIVSHSAPTSDEISSGSAPRRVPSTGVPESSASTVTRPNGSSHCAGFHRQRARASRDRKSTRLNSSHSQISYAVFCLKKKK